MKKTIKVFAAMMILVMLAGVFAFTVSASGVSQSDVGIDISSATPEEIEDIGMAAMLEAGLISAEDANIVDASQPAENASENAEKNSGASVWDIVNFVLALIAVLAVASLYVVCWKTGVFNGGKAVKQNLSRQIDEENNDFLSL